MKTSLTSCLNHIYNVEKFAEAWISPALMEALGCWNSRRRNLFPSWKKTVLVFRKFLCPCNNTDLQLAWSQCFLPTLGVNCLHFRIYCLLFKFLRTLFRPWCCWSFSTTCHPAPLCFGQACQDLYSNLLYARASISVGCGEMLWTHV